MRRLGCLILVAMCARSVAAQTPIAAAQGAAPSAAFVGFLKSTVDSGPVRSADVRLFYIDSTREVIEPLGLRSIETFVDTLRSRLAVSDSSGYFAVWRLPPGRYLMHTRRIGFNPIEAFVTVDSETVLHEFAMEPLVSILSKVEIHDVSTASLSRRLDRVGFLNRKKFNGGEGTFITPADMERFRPSTVRDILSRYGIYRDGPDFRLDKMALSYDDIQDYPAEMIAGIEIYRHGRPIEYNMTRSGPNLLQPGGAAFQSQFLVLIWTYIP